MRFLNPQFLPLLWLALIPVVLYLFRRKSRVVRVSTLLFFTSLAREHQESAWLRRLKRWLSFLLTLLILCAPILALARLVLSPAGTSARSVVILVDRSASMAAREATGKSRFDEARDRMRAMLETTPESVPIALVAYDQRPHVVQARSTNRRALVRLIDGIELRPIEDDAAAALEAAEQIAALETPAEIWHFTDSLDRADPRSPDGGSSADRSHSMPTGVSRRVISLALARPLNAGITVFSVKKVPLLHARYQAYVQVALNSSADGKQTVVLEPQVGGLPLARREMSLAPGEVQGLTLDLEGAQEQVVEIALELPGDQFSLDDRVVARLPAPRPLLVAWFTPRPDPFTELALKSLIDEGEFEVFAGGPAQWPPERAPDVVVFDGWLPSPWPSDIPAVVINPPTSAGPIRALALDPPVPRDAVRVVDEHHPVLFRVSSSRVSLTQTTVLDASGSLEPLWLAGDQAVLLAGESAGQRLVVLGAAPSLSEQLPLTPSYPLLLGNALYWCAEKSDSSRVPRLAKTGEFLEAGGALEWREFRNGKLGAPIVVPVTSPHAVELDRIGLWRTTDGSREGSSLLLSRQETDVPGARPASNAGLDAGAPQARHPRFRGDLAWWFIALTFGALILESWLFHRHAVN